jgi:hypothetical protein
VNAHYNIAATKWRRRGRSRIKWPTHHRNSSISMFMKMILEARSTTDFAGRTYGATDL